MDEVLDEFTLLHDNTITIVTYRLPCDFFVFVLLEDPLRSIVIGIGDAYPCSASAKNTTVFTRSVAMAEAAETTVEAEAEASVTAVSTTAVSGGGREGDGLNLPLSRLSRYSAACNKAAMLIFGGGRKRGDVPTHTRTDTQTHSTRKKNTSGRDEISEAHTHTQRLRCR